MTDQAARSPSRQSRAYATVLRLAERAHQRRLAVGLVAAPLLTMLLAALNQWVLLGFPNSGDEYNYLYQAETFAAGRLWNTPPRPPELFAMNYIVQEPARVFSSFPFGWPLVLALALKAGLPRLIVNRLLGTLTLGLVWALGARLYSGRAGVLAAALVGVSPFFLFNAASYFSHTFCGALLLGAAVVSSRDDRRSLGVPLAVGFLIGWAVVTRYLTGVICGVPIALWLLRPGAPRLRLAVGVALGGLPWVLALAAYNQVMTGDPFRLTTTALTVSLWFREGWLLRSADILSTHLLRHLLWTPFAVVPGYVFYLWAARPDARRGALDWIPVITVVVLYFYVERGGNQYGPRFHYEVFLFAVVFVAGHLLRTPALDAPGRRDHWVFALLAASVLVQPVLLVVHATTERRVIQERMDPFVQAERAGLREAIVLIGDRVGTARSMAATDLTRNGIAYDGPVLFGVDAGDGRACELLRQRPDRRPYLYGWDPGARRGVLREADCRAVPAQ